MRSPLRSRKGVMSTIGIIFMILLAITILLIAVFMASGVSFGVVKSQQYHLVSIIMPHGLYNETTRKLLEITGGFKNPNDKPVTVHYIKIKNATIPVNIVFDPNEAKRIELDVSSYNIYLDDQDIARGYIEAYLVTDSGAELFYIEIYGVR